MDERKLAELFRDAVHDPPPASFGEQDVLAASQRARLRRRNGILTGSALAVVLLVSGVFTGIALWGDGQRPGQTTASTLGEGQPDGGGLRPFEAPAPGAQVPSDRAQRPRQEVPTESPVQGGTPPGRTGPSANGCGQADRELAAALAGELPAAAVVGQPVQVTLSCPPGARGAALQVRDDARVGVLTVVLAPRGSDTPRWASSPPSGTAYPTTAASGSLLVLVSEPAAGAADAPFGTKLTGFAEKLSARF